MKQKCRRRDIK